MFIRKIIKNPANRCWVLQKSALSDYGAGVSTVENLCRIVIPRDLFPYLR